MPPPIAAIVFVVGIAGVFWLERVATVRTSKALWIPTIWLWILGSREVSIWMATFGFGTAGTWSSELEGSPIDRNVYVTLLVAGVSVLATRGQEVRRVLAKNVPLVVFLLYCALSVMWSDFPMVSLKRWIKAVTDVVMVMIVLTDRDHLAAIKRLLMRAGVVLTPLSILIIKYFPEIAMRYNPEKGSQVIIGVTYDKNFLGSSCLLFGVMFLWRFLAARQDRESPHRARHLIAHGTMLVMVLWLFSKANSMTSLLCFVMAAGLLTATFLSTYVRRPSMVSLLVALAMATAMAPVFFGLGTGLLTTVGRDATLTGRTDIWRDALAVSNNPLLGAGFESFWLTGPLDIGRKYHVNEAHNGYLELYLNLGLIGVTLMLGIVVAGFRNVLATLGRDPVLGALWLSFFVIGLTYNLSEAGFRMMNPVWICFLLAATAVPERAPALATANAALDKRPARGMIRGSDVQPSCDARSVWRNRSQTFQSSPVPTRSIRADR
jgi:exopolysaccharide production protein ExoQ